jgi:hypothetical protein
MVYGHLSSSFLGRVEVYQHNMSFGRRWGLGWSGSVATVFLRDHMTIFLIEHNEVFVVLLWSRGHLRPPPCPFLTY